MPQLQIVDSSPRKQEPSGVTELFSKLSESYKENEDRVQIGKLIDEYKSNRDDANAWENLQLGLEKSNISPTKRIQTQNSLNEMKKQIIERDKNLNAQAKAEITANDKKLKDQKVEEEKAAKSANEQASVESMYIENGWEPEEAKRLSKFDSPATAQAKIREKNLDKRAAKKVEDKKAIEEAEKEKSQAVTQKAFDNIASLVPKVGASGIVQSYFGQETAGAYAEFTSLTGALESLLVEKVNRGTLSNVRFKYITETLLPKPSDSQETIKGKLKGLATILELDDSALGDSKGEKKNAREGMVQVTDPQGVKRWVPKEVADQLKG